MTDTIVDQVSLQCQDGHSDKVYHAQVTGNPATGYQVHIQYGRRGGTLATGTKTSGPVSLENATKCFCKLVKEKTGKGYVPMHTSQGVLGAGVASQPTLNGQPAVSSGILPQLLNECDAAAADAMIENPSWFAQEKMNGERRLLQSKAGEILGINRRGFYVALPHAIHDAAMVMASRHGDFVLDGEQIGDVLHVFDVLEARGGSLRDASFENRDSVLSDMLVLLEAAGAIRGVAVHSTSWSKRALFNAVRNAGGEGVVFKRRYGHYVPGRPNSGGDQLKFKFVHTATVLAVSRNDHARSVKIGAFDDAGVMVPIGNVTIPPNRPVPYPDMLIEVEYLYAYRGGSLYQPVYLGPRDDLDAEAAVLSQLHYKPDTE